jgi:hypothetical protein
VRAVLLHRDPGAELGPEAGPEALAAWLLAETDWPALLAAWERFGNRVPRGSVPTSSPTEP